jgi:hypothetical protein
MNTSFNFEEEEEIGANLKKENYNQTLNNNNLFALQTKNGRAN